ncbi:MAG: hypothetical protein LUD16_12635 [Lachnospiraceae bacterium]|nr:hypothetical protein [Lachnospiraceae bacterium]
MNQTDEQTAEQAATQYANASAEQMAAQPVGHSGGRFAGDILPILLFLAFGLLTGSVLPEILKLGSGNYAGLTSRYSFRIYESLRVNQWELFCYVMSVRMPVLLILWMSSFTTLGIFFHLGYAWWILASGSMLLALFCQRSGFQGVVQFCCCIFPQWFFYGILWKRELTIWLRRGKERPEWAGGSVRKLCRKDFSELVHLAALCFLGCACEAFLGTWMLQLYLQL